MSDQKNNKKLEKSLEALSGKQRAKAAAEKKEARKWKTYGIVTCVVAVLVAALLFWDAGFIQRRAAAVTVGEKSYSAAEVDYYYFSLYNNMYALASYYNLDTSKSLKEQNYSDDTTWYQYLCDNAKSSLTNVSTLAQEAKAAGFEMSEEIKADVAEAIQNTKDSAAENNVSYSFYLKRIFGRFMTPSIYEKVITEYQYAYAYEDYKTESFEVSDEDIQSYYEENKNSIDTYDYVCYRVNAMPETKDEDGKELTLTKEDYDQAAKAAKKTAKALMDAVVAGDEAQQAALLVDDAVTDYSDISSGSLSSYTFGEWLADSERKAGDAEVVEQTTKVTIGDASSEEEEVVQYYFATVFNNRYLDEYEAATMHTITVEAHDAEENADADAAEAKAQELMQQFEAAGSTEEAFLALSEAEEEEHDEDEDAGDVHVSAHTYEKTGKGVLTDEQEEWLFGKDHQVGDVELLKDSDGSCQLVFFVGYAEDAYWRVNVRSTLRSGLYRDWYEEVSKGYEAVEKSFFSQVG